MKDFVLDWVIPFIFVTVMYHILIILIILLKG